MRRSAALLALLLLASPALAQAQQPTTTQLNPRDAARAAYSLRRQGRFDAAGAAFEALLEALPREARDEKRLVGFETAEMYKVTGRLDKALQLYRANHDFAGEFEVLFLLNRVDEALTVARLVRYPRGEAEALARLGRVDEALRLLEERGLNRERAELLMSAGRYPEAARAYADLSDFYQQAQALEAAGDAGGARRAYDDAKIQIADHWRNEKKPALDRFEAQLSQAPDGIARERARLRLARALGEASVTFERLALVYQRTGEPPEKVAQICANAKTFTERQRDRLLDAAPAPDLYGQEMVRFLSLPDRIATLERQIADYRAGRGGPRTPATPPRRPGR